MENNNLNEPPEDRLEAHNPDHPIDNHVFNEETAAELTDDRPLSFEEDQEDDHDEVRNMYGWIAIALSAISFFVIPLLFAGAGVILGFIARGREAPVLGNTAIAIGVLSILVRLFILPLI